MFKKKIITREDGTPYLIRTYLLKTSFFQIVIHKILQSDNDCLHDHPWNFITFILKGGYWEGTTPEQVLQQNESNWFKNSNGHNATYFRWYGRFSLLFRKAEWKHRLKLQQSNGNGKYEKGVTIPCTALVIMFKRRREWGFFTKSGWVHWSKYKSIQRCD